MMDDGLMLNVSDLDIKKLSSQLSAQSQQQNQQQQQQQHSQQQTKQQQKQFQQATSVASNVTISDDITNVHSLLGTHTFVSIGGSNGASSNQQQSSLQHQQQQQQDSQQQSFLQQHQRNTANHAATSIMVDQEVQNICQDNQKLSAIARICIHLVDRCRALNKSKQFTEDLNKLGSMIDDFNRNKARNTLPTFTNAGLVFVNGNGGQSLTTSITPSVSTSTVSSNSNKHSLIGNNNMVFIPISSAGGHHSHQSLSIQHFVTDDDEEAVHKLQQQVQQQQQQQQQQQESRNKQHHKQMNRKSTNQHVVTMHQTDTADSILFKKLTESGQIIAVERELTATTGKEASISPQSGGSHHQSGSNQMLAIPLNQLAHLNEQNTLFSIVNQMDTSNIENTPNLNNKATKFGKVYKCNMCAKVFANSYNLNRHMKSHTGFQPFECYFQDCRKRFNYNYHLKRHMETHTGERPFVCSWPNCDQRFNRKYNLNRHLWIHTEHKNKQTAAL